MKKASILLIFTLCITSIFAQEALIGKNGEFTDSRDGKTYKTVSIGTQVWMAENLAYKASSGCWAYNDSISNVSKYGYLYSWETAKDVCPVGWHLPSDEEWTTLINYLGGADVAGEKLKSASGWKLYEGKNYGNNESGFNALPSGLRYTHNGEFEEAGKVGRLWSSTPHANRFAWYRYLFYDGSRVYRLIEGSNFSFGVRCIKD
jgi:uncharacterized protein (TIGR02145 family)